MSTEFHPLSQPDEIPIREKEDAMGAYLMMFASVAVGLPLPFLSIIASIIYYYLNKKDSRFVKFHALQALYSHIPVVLLNSVGIVWTIYNAVKDLPFDRTFKGYAIMTAVANIVFIVFTIIGAVKARHGRMYYFWFFGKVCYMQAYQVKAIVAADTLVNKPPQI